MGKSVNKVILLGNVGQDPKIHRTASNFTVAEFSLATAERQKDQQDNWQDRTEWHNLVAIGKTAELVRDYVKKGSRLYVEGKLETRSWDDQQGNKKFATSIKVVNLIFADSGPGPREVEAPSDWDSLQ